MQRRSQALGIVILAGGLAGCSLAKRPVPQPLAAERDATLWRSPTNLATHDLYHGPWGAARAPDANAVYTFVERKHSGVNPGMTVVDPDGREWSVKQPLPNGLDDEAPPEVALSRLLSAIGYHQPAVYYLPRFTLKDDWGTHTEVGGRFRLKDETLKEVGTWRWDENPFVGTRPYQGLLVMMMMFNSTDLKSSNNSLYERRNGDRVERWYAVRDIGAALGDTKRIAPRKNHPEAFERQPFILGVNDRHVTFAYGGWYKPLVQDRITTADVAWATSLLARLSERQWRDAFRAGGYPSEVGDRFIRRLRQKVRQGQDVAGPSVRLEPDAASASTGAPRRRG